MDLTWNLQDLFENNQDFYIEIENIKKMMIDIKKYENVELDENSLYDILDAKWKIKELTNNVLIYGSLMYYKNIKSDECIKMKSLAESFSNQINLELSFIDRKILSLGKEKIDNFVKENNKLEIYKVALDNLFRMQEHVQNDDVNAEIKRNIDSINSQLNLYNSVLKNIKYGNIEIDGELVEITATNFAKYLSSRNREIREQTYLIVNQKFKDEEKTFANILDLIFGYRIENAELKNYDSVLQKVLFEENIDSKIVETLIKAVNNNICLIQKYLKIKSDILGIDQPHLYDFGVPLDDNLKIKYSFDEAIEIIKNALNH